MRKTKRITILKRKRGIVIGDSSSLIIIIRRLGLVGVSMKFKTSLNGVTIDFTIVTKISRFPRNGVGFFFIVGFMKNPMVVYFWFLYPKSHKFKGSNVSAKLPIALFLEQHPLNILDTKLVL